MGSISGWAVSSTHRVCIFCGYRVPVDEYFYTHWTTNCVNPLLKTAVALAWQGGP